MKDKSPSARKGSVIPGYSGYVPKVNVNNHFLGKRVTEQAREVFKPDVLDKPENTFSTTGFNASQIPRADASLHATSRRYGTRTMMDTAPNHQPVDYFTTTTRASFKSPSVHDRPNLRARDPNCTFENSAKLIMAKRSNTNASGYESNRQLWDGQSWGTEKNQHTDQYRTSYRMGFNVSKPFHKPELRVTDGRLRQKQQVFDVSDK